MWRGIVSVFLFSLSALAQSLTGNLVGTVRDTSGGAVPGVAVNVRNTGTNETRQAQSSSGGEFTVPNLAPGLYEVTAERAGFAVLRETNLELQVNQTARLELVLKVGSIVESVEVKAEIPLLNTENSAKGDVIATAELTEMPLDGRSFQDLAFLVPGVQRSAEGDNGSPFAINGARSDNTNFYVDGFNNRDPRFGGAQANPNLDSMQEFKLETAGYSAEYGRLAGGVVSVVLKSGSNQFHGSVFEFLRNDRFDARNFFADDKNKLRRNQFGATLSGPVWIPKVFQGRNRAFFLFSWESYRDSTGNLQLSRVPTAPERAGDFSQTRDAAGKLVTLKDPFAANTFFPGNQIPLSRFSPVSTNVLPYWPLPNRPGQTNNYLANAVNQSPWNSFLWKFDNVVSARDNVSFRYQRRVSNGSTPFPASPVGGFGTTNLGLQHLLGLNLTHLFTPSLINEFRFSLSRNTSHQQNFDGGRNFAAEFGIAGVTSDAHLTGFPAITVRDLATIGDKADRPSDTVVNLYQWSDAVTWVKGRHQIKFGGEILRSQTFQPYYNNNRGTFNFLGNWTSQPFADFLLGTLESASRQTTPPLNYLFATSYGTFAQDDFKITGKLTLNLGMRWEIPGPQYDKFGRYSGFVRELGKVIVADDRGVSNLDALVASVKLTGVVGLARDYGIPQSLVYTRYKNLAPRFGFAWRPFAGNRMVVRGGYGIFVAGSGNNALTLQMSNVFPFAINQTVNRNTTNPAAVSFADPFKTASGGSVSVGGVDLHAETSYLQSWNLTLEREVQKLGAVEIAYAGSKGTHLGNASDINRNYYSDAQTLLPRTFPQIGNAINYFTFGGNSIYNSGMVTWRRRFSKGFFYRVNYVYAKSIDDASTFSGGGNGGPRQIQDPRNLRAERGRSNFDTGHSFTMNFSYTVPWRRPELKWLMRGWQVAGSGRAYTGQPFTPTNSNFNWNLGGPTRPDRVAKGTVANPTPDRWFDIAAFPLVPNGSFRYGGSGRNILDGPGYVGINPSLYRNMQVGERGQLQFRWELFNALNHTNFNLPNTSVSAINGATIASAQAARTMQFGLRYQF